MMDNKKYPLVGIGVLIYNDNNILLGKRINAHGNLCWGPPGGHLEFGESFESAARREVIEETGLRLGNVIQGPITNDFFAAEQKHYISVFMIGKYCGGTPEIREPHKCANWQWFGINNLPQPLFLPLQTLIDQRFDFAYYRSNNHSKEFTHP